MFSINVWGVSKLRGRGLLPLQECHLVRLHFQAIPGKSHWTKTPEKLQNPMERLDLTISLETSTDLAMYRNRIKFPITRQPAILEISNVSLLRNKKSTRNTKPLCLFEPYKKLALPSKPDHQGKAIPLRRRNKKWSLGTCLLHNVSFFFKREKQCKASDNLFLSLSPFTAVLVYHRTSFFRSLSSFIFSHDFG